MLGRLGLRRGLVGLEALGCLALSSTSGEFQPPRRGTKEDFVALKAVTASQPPLPSALEFAESKDKLVYKHNVKKDTRERVRLQVEASATLRELEALGVDLRGLFRDHWGILSFLSKKDFASDIRPLLDFLVQECGLEEEGLGEYLSRNPWVFNQSLAALKRRVGFLKSKDFDDAAIGEIVLRAKYVLNMSPRTVNEALRWLSEEFSLADDQTRSVVTKAPKLLSFGGRFVGKVRQALHSAGLREDETRRMLLAQPKVFQTEPRKLVATLLLALEELGVERDVLCDEPRLLTKPAAFLVLRHRFLQSQGLARYVRSPLPGDPRAADVAKLPPKDRLAKAKDHGVHLHTFLLHRPEEFVKRLGLSLKAFKEFKRQHLREEVPPDGKLE